MLNLINLSWISSINTDVPFRDLNTILNLCYSAAWMAGVTCILHFTYKFIKEYTYVTVNCWFCNQDSRVPFNQKREWTCPQCEQFNGFTKDGDYSKLIPEQFDERLSVRKCSPTVNQHKSPSLNGLCRTCNINQELKIRLIASYVPLKEKEYDLEVELYRNKLEQSYKLCSICERTVQSTLKLKSRMYCEKNSLGNGNNSEKQFMNKKYSFKKWNYFFKLLLAGLTVVFLWNFWKFHERISEYKISILLSEIFNRSPFPDVDRNSSFLLNIFFSIFIALFTKIYFERSKRVAVSNLLLFSVLSCVTNDYIYSELKIAGIIFALIYIAYKFVKQNVCIDAPEISSTKCCTIVSEIRDHSEGMKKPPSCRAQNLDLPICGKLSDLNLGSVRSNLETPKPSYLFKSSSLLVQPAKLILDDPDESTDTIRTFHTVSSGYDSSVSSFKKSSDSISEFDSVSQVGYRYSSNSRRSSPNALISCRGYQPSFCPTSERLYDVYPSSSQSKIQVSAFFSAIQILLCSLAFFILGFSFQILLSNLTS